MKIWMTIALVALTAPALAQEPTQAEKTAALKRAYELNGNSMVGWGSIDLADAPAAIRTIPIDGAPKVIPAPPPAKVAAVEPERPDICRRHGKRKVVRGRSWRCR